MTFDRQVQAAIEGRTNYISSMRIVAKGDDYKQKKETWLKADDGRKTENNRDEWELKNAFRL